jgi:putative ABC transport system permease protein
MSKSIAAERHLHVGQAMVLPSPTPTVVRLAGLITNLGWPSGAIILNANDYAKAWGSTAVSAYQLTLTAGAATASVLREIRTTLGPRSALIAETATHRERRHDVQASQGLSRLTSIRTLVLVASVLAMAAAMGSMIVQRRARLTALKLHGYTDLAVWRTLLFESVLLLGSGCLIGGVFGLGGQVVGSRAILAVTGFPVIFSLALAFAILCVLLISAVAVLIVAAPGYVVARMRPVAGLSE